MPHSSTFITVYRISSAESFLISFATIKDCLALQTDGVKGKRSRLKPSPFSTPSPTDISSPDFDPPSSSTYDSTYFWTKPRRRNSHLDNGTKASLSCPRTWRTNQLGHCQTNPGRDWFLMCLRSWGNLGEIGQLRIAYSIFFIEKALGSISKFSGWNLCNPSMGTSRLSGAGSYGILGTAAASMVQGRGTIAKINPSQSTKTIALYPTLRIGGRIYVHPLLPFHPPRKRKYRLGVIKGRIGIRWFDKPRKNTAWFWHSNDPPCQTSMQRFDFTTSIYPTSPIGSQ